MDPAILNQLCEVDPEHFFRFKSDTYFRDSEGGFAKLAHPSPIRSVAFWCLGQMRTALAALDLECPERAWLEKSVAKWHGNVKVEKALTGYIEWVKVRDK